MFPAGHQSHFPGENAVIEPAYQTNGGYSWLQLGRVPQPSGGWLERPPPGNTGSLPTMKKLIPFAVLALAVCGFTAPTASAKTFGLFTCGRCCGKCCGGCKSCTTICVRQYNAFTPVCCGNICMTGCCMPFGGPMGGGQDYGQGCGPMGCGPMGCGPTSSDSCGGDNCGLGELPPVGTLPPNSQTPGTGPTPLPSPLPSAPSAQAMPRQMPNGPVQTTAYSMPYYYQPQYNYGNVPPMPVPAMTAPSYWYGN